MNRFKTVLIVVLVSAGIAMGFLIFVSRMQKVAEKPAIPAIVPEQLSEIEVVPQILSIKAIRELENCGTVNTEPPTSTVTYTNREKGLSFELPYNDQWEAGKYKLLPFEEDSGGIIFGFPLGDNLKGCPIHRSYRFHFYKRRVSTEEIIEGLKKAGYDYSRSSLNGLTVITYIELGLSTYPTMEVIGSNFSVKFIADTGDEEATLRIFEDIVRSIKDVE